jgi:hypothetical protein
MLAMNANARKSNAKAPANVMVIIFFWTVILILLLMKIARIKEAKKTETQTDFFLFPRAAILISAAWRSWQRICCCRPMALRLRLSAGFAFIDQIPSDVAPFG